MKIKKFGKINKLYALWAGGLALESNMAHADLNGILTSSNTLMTNAAQTINILAMLTGAYFIYKGVMAWRKSADEHGGHSIEFKSVAIPILSGALLVAFTAFVAATSSTFGFSSTYP